jgi:DNA-binding CsgD family transcriptional regulator
MSALVNAEISKSILASPGSRVFDSNLFGASDLKWNGMRQLLDRFGLGYLVFDDRSKVVDWNAAAKTKLNITSDAKDPSKDLAGSFRQMVNSVPCKLCPNTLTWIVFAHKGGVPSIVHEKSDLAPHNSSIVLLLDRETRPYPNVERFQELFGLTTTEAQVLASIACGHTLLEIARNRRLSRTTIRSHLAQLFAKTDTRRQSELVALIDSFAVLP